MELLLGQCRARRCVVCRRLELLRRRPALFPLRRLVNLYAMKTPIARVVLNGDDRCCDRPSPFCQALFMRIKSAASMCPMRCSSLSKAGSVCSSDGARVGPATAFMRRNLATGDGTNAFVETARSAPCLRLPLRSPPLSCNGLYAHKDRPGFTTPPAALRFGVLPDCRAPEANSPTTSPDSRSSRSAHSETRYNTCLHHPR